MIPGASSQCNDRTGFDRRFSNRSTRRRLLEWIGSAGLLFLSGCTEDVGEELPPNTKWPTGELKPELPVAETSDIFDERIEAVADETITDEDEFAEVLAEYDLEVEGVDRERDALTIEYASTERDDAGTIHDVAPIAGGFAALVDSGDDSRLLESTVLDEASSAYGSAYIRRTWAERYNVGELSAVEYGELVATTIESNRDPPSVGISPDE